MGVTGLPGIAWSTMLLGSWHPLPSVGSGLVAQCDPLGTSGAFSLCQDLQSDEVVACLPPSSARDMAWIPKCPSRSPCIKGRG